MRYKKFDNRFFRTIDRATSRDRESILRTEFKYRDRIFGENIYFDFLRPLKDFLEPYCSRNYSKWNKKERIKVNTPDRRFFLILTEYRKLRNLEHSYGEAMLALKILEYQIGRQNEKEGISNPRNKKYD